MLNVLKRSSLNSSWQINKKITDLKLIVFNPFVNGFADTSLIAGSSVLTNSILINRTSALWGLDITQTPTAAPYKLVWRNQAGDSITNSIGISNVPAGNYTLQVQDKYNCSTTKTFLISSAITILPDPIYDAVRVKRGTGATTGVKNYQTGAVYKLFATDFATVPLQQNTTGRFTLSPIFRDTTVYVQFEKEGCTSKKVAVYVSVYDEVNITVPTAFSPNNDGINDIMTISTEGIQALTGLTIFDRYGKAVYKSNNPQKGWNGKSNNSDLPVGTYYYVLDAIDDNKLKLTKQGSITLLR
jgi:gliding motility-associated-like protein